MQTPPNRKAHSLAGAAGTSRLTCFAPPDPHRFLHPRSQPSHALLPQCTRFAVSAAKEEASRAEAGRAVQQEAHEVEAGSEQSG